MARFLVIDDEMAVGTLIMQYLEAEGHKVYVAQDAETGLRMFKEHPCDIVICDLVLPGFSGIDTLKTLKRHRPEITVAAISGFPGSIQELISDPILHDIYLMTKPFNSDDLEVFVRRLLCEAASK